MDYEGLKGTTALKLNESNYISWAELVQAYLEARDHWEVINRTYIKPVKVEVNDTETQESKEDIKKWRRTDRKA